MCSRWNSSLHLNTYALRQMLKKAVEYEAVDLIEYCSGVTSKSFWLLPKPCDFSSLPFHVFSKILHHKYLAGNSLILFSIDLDALFYFLLTLICSEGRVWTLQVHCKVHREHCRGLTRITNRRTNEVYSILFHDLCTTRRWDMLLSTPPFHSIHHVL